MNSGSRLMALYRHEDELEAKRTRSAESWAAREAEIRRPPRKIKVISKEEWARMESARVAAERTWKSYRASALGLRDTRCEFIKEYILDAYPAAGGDSDNKAARTQRASKLAECITQWLTISSQVKLDPTLRRREGTRCLINVKGLDYQYESDFTNGIRHNLRRFLDISDRAVGMDDITLERVSRQAALFNKSDRDIVLGGLKHLYEHKLYQDTVSIMTDFTIAAPDHAIIGWILDDQQAQHGLWLTIYHTTLAFEPVLRVLAASTLKLCELVEEDADPFALEDFTKFKQDALDEVQDMRVSLRQILGEYWRPEKTHLEWKSPFEPQVEESPDDVVPY